MIKRVLILSLALVLLGIITFYLVIGLGLSPKLQTIWVTTAMTTMDHQWLATSIVSKTRIENIMRENYVDDSKYESEIIEIVEEVTEEVEVSSPKRVLTDKYEDEGYKKLEDGVYVKEISGSGWRGNVMLVKDPKRVSLTDTPKQFERGWSVMKMTESSGAVAGINGGGFVDGPNYDSNGGIPAGLIIKDGILINPKRYGDEKYQMIGINKDGVLVLKHTTVEWALDNDIQHAVTFSPFIVVNGEGTIKKGTGGWGIAPRTAMGQRETGEMLFIVIDGRQPSWSVGVDLKVLQDVMLEENIINGAMLDGGSSTVMVYNGEFVNKPSLGKERYINNAWIVK